MNTVTGTGCTFQQGVDEASKGPKARKSLPWKWQNGGVRIAIDTNVLIAAVTRPGGRSARLVDAWLAGEIEAVASEATVREAELVLGGRWLRRP